MSKTGFITGVAVMLSAAVMVASSGNTHGTGTSLAPRVAPSEPPEVANRVVLPPCGGENATTQRGPWNQPGRECFWEAYLAHHPAEFISTRLSIEGDPITSIYRVLGGGRVEVFVDDSRDRYPAVGGWARLDCSALATPGSLAPPPDFGPDDCLVTPLHPRDRQPGRSSQFWRTQ